MLFLSYQILKYLLSPLKSECKESCNCRCILPVCWGYRPDSKEHGMLQHEAFGPWCFLWKASHPHSSQQCRAPCVLVTAGLEFWLCWVSGILGRIGCAAWWQWRCPLVPVLCELPSESVGSLAPSIPIRLLAGKNLMQVVVSVAGGCMRVVTSRDHAAWQVLRREIRDFTRGQHQNWGCGKAYARSLDGPADLPQHWWSDHNQCSWAVDSQEVQCWVREERKKNKEI